MESLSHGESMDFFIERNLVTYCNSHESFQDLWLNQVVDIPLLSMYITIPAEENLHKLMWKSRMIQTGFPRSQVMRMKPSKSFIADIVNLCLVIFFLTSSNTNQTTGPQQGMKE